MTTYQKHLIEIFNQKYPTLSNSETIEKLIEMGVVDFTRCKVLAVREYVVQRQKEGSKKIDAMWIAAEHFGASYEYIRKCIYYYTDVNIE